jgi:adenosylmethionine-8-amino-7-oxononanoate aminotransferase
VPFPATWDDDPEVEAKEQAALEALDLIFASHPDHVAAVIIEPLIQGAAGMRMCRPQFLKMLEARVRDNDSLLIADEVMTGFGRTGGMFACVKAGITPDLVCLSKGLTGGFLPLSMTVAREAIFKEFLGPDLGRAFLHGHSYTANPLGCAAGLASLDLLQAPDCMPRIQAIEALHRVRLDALRLRANIARTRLCGTIAALDVTGGGEGYGAAIGARLKQDFLERGLLLRPLGNVLYMLPPYCTTEAELNRAWDAVDEVLEKV